MAINIKEIDLNEFFKKRIKLFLILLLVLHAMVLFSFYISPIEIFNGEPFYTVDYAQHFYDVYIASKYLSIAGITWGYDPFFMAGYPNGVLFAPGNKAVELFCYIFSFIDLVVAFKIFVFLTFLLVPLVMYLASRKVGLDEFESVLASCLASALWYLDPLMQSIIGWGLFSFGFICPLSVLVYAFFYSYLFKPHPKDFILLCLLGALAFLFHPLVLISLVVPFAVLYGLRIKKLSLTTNLSLLFWILFVLAYNSFWIMPLVKFWKYKIYSGVYLQGDGLKSIIRDFFYKGGYGVRTIIFYCGLIGLYKWKKEKRRIALYTSVLTAVIFLLLISYFGKYFAILANIQPYRFLMPMSFFLILPAAEIFGSMIRTIKDYYLLNKKVMTAFFIIVLLSAPLFGESLRGVIQRRQVEGTSVRHISTFLPKEAWELIEWIKSSTTNDARILVQDGPVRQYYNSHLIALFPFLTSREFIGGPSIQTWILHYRIAFSGDLLSQKNISNFATEELRTYFDYYNIKWIIAWSEKATMRFKDDADYITKLTQIGKFSIYEVNRTPSYFLKGSGKVEATYNKIKVTDATPGEIILKYHWLETLKTEPEMKIEPVMVLDDPVGFIKVDNGDISSFTIYNGY